MSGEYLAQAITDHFRPSEDDLFVLNVEADPYTAQATTAGRMVEVDGGLCTCSDVDSLAIGALQEFTITGA